MCKYDGFTGDSIGCAIVWAPATLCPNLESQPLSAVEFYQGLSGPDKPQNAFGEDLKWSKWSLENNQGIVRTPLLRPCSASLMGWQWKGVGWTHFISQTAVCRQREAAGTLFLWRSPQDKAQYGCCGCVSSQKCCRRVGCWIHSKDLLVVIQTGCPNVDKSYLYACILPNLATLEAN